jgi:hypothetical protein
VSSIAGSLAEVAWTDGRQSGNWNGLEHCAVGHQNSSSLWNQQLRFTCKRLASSDDDGYIRDARVPASVSDRAAPFGIGGGRSSTATCCLQAQAAAVGHQNDRIHAASNHGSDDEDRLDAIRRRLGIVGKNGLRPLVCGECSCRGQHECGLGGTSTLHNAHLAMLLKNR